MRTVIISAVSIGSVLLVIMIQSAVNVQTSKRLSLEESLSAAMYQTMSEVMEGDRYGIADRNQMVAAFLQAMIQRVDTDMDLTVRIHEVDMQRGEMDVEATGTYELPGRRTKVISVRRQIAFTG